MFTSNFYISRLTPKTLPPPPPLLIRTQNDDDDDSTPRRTIHPIPHNSTILTLRPNKQANKYFIYIYTPPNNSRVGIAMEPFLLLALRHNWHCIWMEMDWGDSEMKPNDDDNYY